MGLLPVFEVVDVKILAGHPLAVGEPESILVLQSCEEVSEVIKRFGFLEFFIRQPDDVECADGEVENVNVAGFHFTF